MRRFGSKGERQISCYPERFHSWNYKLYPSSSSYNIEISALTTNDNDHIVAAVEYSYALSGSKDGGSATTIVSSNPKNSVYDAIKIEYLYHSNKLEGSTFSKENLIDLLEQKKVNR